MNIDVYEKAKIEVYRKMSLVRHAEETISKHYHENQMKTPMHMSRGAEHIAAAVLTACEFADVPSFVYGSYRSHAAYLCKTGDAYGFFLEMLGKTGGPGDGVQGSMHLAAPEKGMMLSSAIVASQIAPAVGHALALKQRKEKGVVVCFLGDGATESGAFWESLNLAALWSVPILFVIEDNELAMSTLKWRRQAYSLVDVMKRYGESMMVKMGIDETMSPMVVFDAASTLIEYSESVPGMMKAHYFRECEHVGVMDNSWSVLMTMANAHRPDHFASMRSELMHSVTDAEVGVEVGEAYDRAVSA